MKPDTNYADITVGEFRSIEFVQGPHCLGV